MRFQLYFIFFFCLFQQAFGQTIVVRKKAVDINIQTKISAQLIKSIDSGLNLLTTDTNYEIYCFSIQFAFKGYAPSYDIKSYKSTTIPFLSSACNLYISNILIQQVNTKKIIPLRDSGVKCFIKEANENIIFDSYEKFINTLNNYNKSL